MARKPVLYASTVPLNHPAAGSKRKSGILMHFARISLCLYQPKTYDCLSDLLIFAGRANSPHSQEPEGPVEWTSSDAFKKVETRP